MRCPSCYYVEPSGACRAKIHGSRRRACQFFLPADIDKRKEHTAPEGAEYALECMRDPQPFPGEDVPEDDGTRLAATIMHKAIVALVAASSGNSERLAAIVARYGGLSYTAVGMRFGISRQAVHKHMMAAIDVNPSLYQVLLEKMPEQEAVTVSGDFSAELEKLNKKLDEVPQCLKRLN